MARTVGFPDFKYCKDPDKANYQNYLAWQAQTAARRRESQTQFNLYQTRTLERMSNQAQFKDEIERETEKNKDLIEWRLSRACDCESCGPESTIRRHSLSEASTSPSSTTGRSSISSLTTQSSRGNSPPGTTLKGPTSPSSRNSLIVSPPPRSRHHKRKCDSESSVT